MPHPSPWSQGAQAAALVTQMAITTVAGGLFGRQADSWLATEPWLSAAGFTLGFTFGMAVLLRTLARPTTTHDDDDSSSPP